MNCPLCPHCYRDDCPWLDQQTTWLQGADCEYPVPNICPHYRGALPAGVVYRLLLALRDRVEAPFMGWAQGLSEALDSLR